MRPAAAVFLAALACQPRVQAQTFSGYAAALVDGFPNVDDGRGGRRPVIEFRPRVLGEYRRDLSSRIRFTAAGFIEALAANRTRGSTTTAAIVRPQELSLEAQWTHADLRVGFSRVVWGRLDEFLPTDVINPLDLTRFFFEGRSEARMPVGLVRARWLPGESFALEAIYVPVYRRGRFDQLDEPTAPFNVRPALPFAGHEPAHTLRNGQGGVRANVTTGRIDWSLSAYRGFEPLPLYQGLIERFPRFTMIGGDVETVSGAWGLRGELAAFVDRTSQTAVAPFLVKDHSLEAGVGVDRTAGRYRIGATLMYMEQLDRRDFTFVGSVDRSFARETRTVRAFAVYNPREESAFARLIGAISLRDNAAIEGSVGWFTGGGADLLARFSDRDFFYGRVKVFF